MDRISTSTVALNAFGPGKNGFKDGDLSQGVSPTDLEAEWFNGVQEELLAVIEAAGITPNATNRAQLLEALNRRAYVPAGAVMAFARITAPSGWLKANGAAISRTAYADLFAAIGTTFGAGDGATTFNLPDMRGQFTRGWDDGRGADVGRAFGSAQGAYVPPVPRDGWTTTGGAPGSITTGRLVVGSGAVELQEGLESLRAAGGDHDVAAGDARPRNTALLYCIKY